MICDRCNTILLAKIRTKNLEIFSPIRLYYVCYHANFDDLKINPQIKKQLICAIYLYVFIPISTDGNIFLYLSMGAFTVNNSF
ncbi:hypothetical protein BHOIPH791_03300 [Bartonella henselae]|nr:hypothetical protein BhenCHDE101_03930 [Bartonella henselae]ETS07328.1 hypothetical protein Q653_01394 [Bartonella henselae JK 42]ETS08491.1 hypothetical protein Q655_00757 [Bartonella henselae JK 51]ETS09038.1 hypothetical protein Q654_00804 [Bartonella henselae JK 50]ETS12029.1 hypothetical protein Q652_01369 [Bartonella henselae JK 41]KEC56328.1 hypothetical protein O97_01295 [Bartonella henselae str. Zeus]KEC59030.1 hypothetical protein O95_01273 [Bartonella henselae JK 53]PNM38444.1 